jgi:hypothetical protein
MAPGRDLAKGHSGNPGPNLALAGQGRHEGIQGVGEAGATGL